MEKKTVKTIGDIAKLANVSKATVSRALNNSSLINQETRERIQAIAKKHNFRINATARSLSLRQSLTIAFVAPVYSPEFLSGEDLFGSEMLGAIGSGLHALGYDLLIVHSRPGEIGWARDYLDSGRVDGFILITSSLKHAQIKSLIELEVPFIGWGIPVPSLSYCSVSGDNFSGGILATQHLIQSARQCIAFIGGPEESPTVQFRYKGYETALQNVRYSVDPSRVIYTDYSFDSGASAMRQLLERSADLDAVFVNSDLMAIAAIQVIQAAGKRVPEDIAVVGYDDLAIASYYNPPLTTIRQNVRLAGELLAQNLIQLIQIGEITNVTLPVELVIRKST